MTGHEYTVLHNHTSASHQVILTELEACHSSATQHRTDLLIIVNVATLVQQYSADCQ